jgi:hypothetical protein
MDLAAARKVWLPSRTALPSRDSQAPVQSGNGALEQDRAIPVTQATNSLSRWFGYAVHRPNRIGNPNTFSNRSVSEWDKSAFTAAWPLGIGALRAIPSESRDFRMRIWWSSTSGLFERFNLELRAEAFNISNTSPTALRTASEARHHWTPPLLSSMYLVKVSGEPM